MRHHSESEFALPVALTFQHCGGTWADSEK